MLWEVDLSLNGDRSCASKSLWFWPLPSLFIAPGMPLGSSEVARCPGPLAVLSSSLLQPRLEHNLPFVPRGQVLTGEQGEPLQFVGNGFTLRTWRKMG